MAAMAHQTMLLVLGLSMAFTVSHAQMYHPVSKVMWYLGAVCADYQREVMNEGMCNMEVIDEMHNHAENVQLPGYQHDLVETYLAVAQSGSMCYSDGMTIYTMVDACDTMTRVCDAYNPTAVDFCSSIVVSTAPPTGNMTFGAGPTFLCNSNRCYQRSPHLMSGSDRLSGPNRMTLAAVTAFAMTAIINYLR